MTSDLEIILEVDLDKIKFNPFQPRRYFNEDELQELALSIKNVGLIHPPLARPIFETDNYELISGERRFKAAQLAGLKKIPLLISSISSPLSAQAALIENIQRVDLNPIEIAKALQRLIQDFRFSQDQLAERIGKKRSTIANYLRLLSLPLIIQEDVLNENLSMGHAKVILGVDDLDKQLTVRNMIIEKGLSVRETEVVIQRMAIKRKEKILELNREERYEQSLAQKLQEILGTKVSLESKGHRGRLCIDYYSLDDLDHLLTFFDLPT